MADVMDVTGARAYPAGLVGDLAQFRVAIGDAGLGRRIVAGRAAAITEQRVFSARVAPTEPTTWVTPPGPSTLRERGHWEDRGRDCRTPGEPTDPG